MDRKEFSLNGKIISFQNLSKFIKSEKNIAEQEDDGYSYIFPEYNLLLYVDYIAQSFMQILISIRWRRIEELEEPIQRTMGMSLVQQM